MNDRRGKQKITLYANIVVDIQVRKEDCCNYFHRINWL